MLHCFIHFDYDRSDPILYVYYLLALSRNFLVAFVGVVRPFCRRFYRRCRSSDCVSTLLWVFVVNFVDTFVGVVDLYCRHFCQFCWSLVSVLLFTNFVGAYVGVVSRVYRHFWQCQKRRESFKNSIWLLNLN